VSGRGGGYGTQKGTGRGTWGRGVHGQGKKNFFNWSNGPPTSGVYHLTGGLLGTGGKTKRVGEISQKGGTKNPENGRGGRKESLGVRPGNPLNTSSFSKEGRKGEERGREG